MKSSRLHLVAMHLVLAACQLPLATADATGAHWGSGTGRRYSHPLLSRGRASVSALRGKVGLAGLRQHQWYPPSPSKEDAFADAPLLGAAEGLLQGNWTGRIHVTAFGADPSGRRDSSPAIQRALDAAWALGSQAGLNLSSYGGPDLGGIVVDFDGGHYTLSAPLVLPKAGGGNLWISNGALHADGGFPAGRFLLEFPVIAAVRHTLRFRYLTFENMEFDAAQRAAGGVKLQDFEETRFHLCLFSGYTEKGLWATGDTGNELFVDECWFREYADPRLCHNTTAKTGSAIHLDNNDHSITNTVVSCSLQGVVVNGSCIVVNGLHVYTEGITRYPLGCVWVTAGSTGTRLEASYFDGCPIFTDDPSEFHISGSVWLLGEGMSSPGLAPVVLTPTVQNMPIAEVEILNNLVFGRAGNYSFVKLNESAPEAGGHSFDHDSVTNVIIEKNTITGFDRARGVRTASTKAELTVQLAFNQSLFLANFSDTLIFKPRRLPMVLYSLQLPAGSEAVPHALVAAGEGRTNTIQVRTERAVSNATLRVTVDQSLYQ